MKTIVLASENPVKVQATLNGFQRMFPDESFTIQTIAVNSGVSNQPLSDAETYQDALNRAHNAARLLPNADYWVGIEGGVEDRNGEMAAFAWVVVSSGSLLGKSRTGTFFLPARVANLIRGGKELGVADDIVFKRRNSKQEDGAVGILTGNQINHARLYEHAVVLALAPFRNVDLYSTTREGAESGG